MTDDREAWLHRNPDALAAVKAGLEQAAAGELVAGPDLDRETASTCHACGGGCIDDAAEPCDQCGGDGLELETIVVEGQATG